MRAESPIHFWGRRDEADRRADDRWDIHVVHSGAVRVSGDLRVVKVASGGEATVSGAQRLPRGSTFANSWAHGV